MRRVVITELGVVSPIGNDVSTFWHNFQSGVCGINTITLYDTTDMPVKIAAEVKDFSVEEYGIDRGMARRSDRYCQFALAAAAQAMEDSAIQGSIDTARLGVYVGSGIGGMQTFINMIMSEEDVKDPIEAIPGYELNKEYNELEDHDESIINSDNNENIS